MAVVKLAELRFNKGLTPEQLGDECGVSGRTIRRLETGGRPTASTAKKLADHFKVQPSDIWPVDDTEAAAA
jgi:transcriptional regulator with XRE-family HTH domain